MNNNKKVSFYSKSTLVPLILIAILIVPVLFTLRQSSAQIIYPSVAVVDHVQISLMSVQNEHIALKPSQLQLQIVDRMNSLPTQESSSLESINHLIITLQMKHMDCGIVNATIVEHSENKMIIEATPLMQGEWVATASFTYNKNNEQHITLQYPFEVAVR